MWVGASESVSKLALGGPSALDFLLRLFLGLRPRLVWIAPSAL